VLRTCVFGPRKAVERPEGTSLGAARLWV